MPARGNGALIGRLAPWVLVACAVLPYLAVRNYPHVHDDHLVRGLGSLAVDARVTWEMLLSGDFFGTFEQPQGRTIFWRPLVLASFRWERLLAGDSWQGYVWLGHVVTVLCHLGASLGLWRLLLALGMGAPSALLAAALFALHPIHVESVAWASGRTDSLPTALCWSATALWIVRKGDLAGALAATLAFVAALLSKEPALLLVGLAVLLGRCRGLSWRRALTAPLIAVTVALILRGLVFGLAPEVSSEGYMGPERADQRWWTWASIIPDLLRFTVWPGPAAPIHPVATAQGWGSAGVLAGLVALLLVIVGALAAWRRRDGPLVLAAVLGLGTLLVIAPWSRFPTGFEEVAGPLYDRYLYAMAAAPAVLLCRWLGAVFDRAPGRTLVLVVVAAAVVGPVTARRATMWSSEEAFARAGLAVAPGSANMWTQLGSAQLEQLRETGDRSAGEAALDSFEQALALSNEHRFAALNRFITLAMMGREGEAELAAEALLARRADDPGVLHNVAGWHASRGRYDVASGLYRRELAGADALPGAAEALSACLQALALAEAQADGAATIGPGIGPGSGPGRGAGSGDGPEGRDGSGGG